MWQKGRASTVSNKLYSWFTLYRLGKLFQKYFGKFVEFGFHNYQLSGHFAKISLSRNRIVILLFIVTEPFHAKKSVLPAIGEGS